MKISKEQLNEYIKLYLNDVEDYDLIKQNQDLKNPERK